MVEKTVKFSVNGHEYDIKYPNVGQYYQIESLKQALSRGYYSAMVSSPLVATQAALDMIDIEANLTVLCPELLQDLKVTNFAELDVRDYKAVRDAFMGQIAPFLKEVNDMLSGAGAEK